MRAEHLAHPLNLTPQGAPTTEIEDYRRTELFSDRVRTPLYSTTPGLWNSITLAAAKPPMKGFVVASQAAMDA